MKTKDKLNDELVPKIWVHDVRFHQKNVSTTDIINKCRKPIKSSKCLDTLLITIYYHRIKMEKSLLKILKLSCNNF